MDYNRTGSHTFPERKVVDSSIEFALDLTSRGSVSLRSECEEINCHRLLQGVNCINSLSSREMDSLTAICDTLLPSIDLFGAGNESLRRLYGTSASMAGVPEQLGGFISGKMKHAALGLLRLALWFLSTWYGTFVMCGRLSLSKKFPYFQRFSQVSQQHREEILVSWSLSSFYLDRLLFKAMKLLTLLIFFTQVDTNNENPSWESMEYHGPDPELLYQRSRTSPFDESRYGPLYRAVIDIGASSRDHLSEKLKKAGFPAPVRSRNLKKSPELLTLRCDAVVVGSGSGGGVVAGVLAKAGYKVLVLEKGNYFARNKLSLLEGPSMDQMYEGNGLLATDDLGVVILAGSTVGGGSAVNWSASIRTPPHVLNEWSEEYELELFSSKAYAQVKSLMNRAIERDKRSMVSLENKYRVSCAVILAAE